jgi:hypothetical protein
MLNKSQIVLSVVVFILYLIIGLNISGIDMIVLVHFNFSVVIALLLYIALKISNK